MFPRPYITLVFSANMKILGGCVEFRFLHFIYLLRKGQHFALLITTCYWHSFITSCKRKGKPTPLVSMNEFIINN